MKAVVYDKWLHSLGGGEVVACNIAKILKDKGYEVLFISGKEVPPSIISDKLKVDLKGIEFKQVWNDETAIKKYTKNCDLFVNASFMDYTIGFARKNIYYTHFPSQQYYNFLGLILTKIVFPIAEHFIKPIESINLINAPIIMKSKPAYLLSENNKYAFTNLEIGRVRVIEFELFIENFSKDVLERLDLNLENGLILKKVVRVNHHHNTIAFVIEFIPKSNTVYLNLNLNQQRKVYELEEGRIYLFYPKIQLRSLSNSLLGDILEKLRVRLRAGIFVDMHKRLDTYQKILANSYFTQKWVKKYWERSAFVVFPPADLLFKTSHFKMQRKNNWICSVGRFFTLGHGKKQEVLVEAFKLFCDRTKQKWELHLVGGLGEETSSIEFFKYLKNLSRGYPIFFHINVSREEVIKIYLKSRIYWHATGFNENENHKPVRFEHFGIAPIEAISAGCIPILYNGGGLPEIIDRILLDKEKNLFSSIAQLVENTRYFTATDYNIDWQKVFELLENNFSVKAFKENFLKEVTSD